MFNTLDWIIVGFYCVGIISLATYVSRAKQKTLQKPTSKINPMQFAPKTTPKVANIAAR